MKVDFSFWSSIKPQEKIIGRKVRRSKKVLPPGWTEIVADAMRSNCMVVFKNHLVTATNDITIHAACGIEGCPVKFDLYIPHPLDKFNTCMTMKTYGTASHYEKGERPLKGHNRQVIGEYLQGKSVTETFYRSMNNSKNPEYSIDVLKKTKSEIKLSERLDPDAILDLLAEKLHGCPCYVQDIGLSPFFSFMWSEDTLLLKSNKPLNTGRLEEK